MWEFDHEPCWNIYGYNVNSQFLITGVDLLFCFFIILVMDWVGYRKLINGLKGVTSTAFVC